MNLKVRIKPSDPSNPTRDRPPGEDIVAKVVGLVENPETGVDLPLDIRGTAFQRRVWKALQQIPPGSTATYAGIAKKIGRRKLSVP